MEERSNKTIMCGVLFLDIVEYSRKPVSGQISLKERFNNFLSEAIRDVPVTDRIILDTGDGAAINFLGDVEDALKAALSMRQSLLDEDPDVEHPLLVRMGINLGPVRLVRDINGQPNIVGDGINVAQRIMGFADAAQILVSRSYYDAVSRLSPHYAGMFHYQGSRTDKHVREHEVYAIGYPGDKTTLRSKSVKRNGTAHDGVPAAMQNAMKMLGGSIAAFRNTTPMQRMALAAAVVATIILLMILLSNRKEEVAPSTPQPDRQEKPASVLPEPGVPVPAGEKSSLQGKPKTPEKTIKEKPKVKPKSAGEQTKSAPQTPDKPSSHKSSADTATGETQILVTCPARSEVFINGVRKGSVGSGPFSVKLEPGSYSVIVSHAGGIHTQNVSLHAGRTAEIRCK